MFRFATKGKSFSKRLFQVTAATTVTGAAFGGIYVATEEKRRRHAARIVHAGFRIANLLGTVGVIVSDYTYSLYYKYTKGLDEL